MKEILELKKLLKDEKAIQLKDLIEITRGEPYKKTHSNNNIPIISYDNFKSDMIDSYILEDDNFDKIKDTNYGRITEECILIYNVSIIKIMIFKPTTKLSNILISHNIIALKPKSNISLEYLYFQLYSTLKIYNFSYSFKLNINRLKEVIILYTDLESQIEFINFQKKEIIYEAKKKFENKIKNFASSNYYNNQDFLIENKKLFIVTEGKTDWKHLKKALERFEQNGFYENLGIEFFEYEDVIGESALNNMLKSYCKIAQPKKYIFIFDRDTEHKDIKKYRQQNFNNHSNNVYSLCIPKVNKNLDKICIEFYYNINDLKTKDEYGRRLFIGNEFLSNGNSKCAKYVTEKRHSKELDILDSEKRVYLKNDNMWKNNIALSKNDFAENTLYEKGKFINFNIENFKLIFDVIRKILKDEKPIEIIG